jgi:uncharacterized protein (DUF305 family)
MTVFRNVILAACWGAAIACGGSVPVETAPAPETAPPAPANQAGSGMRLPHTEADVHFMSGMIGHHAQAIVMAQLAETNGASSPVQILAGRIINAQQDEIATAQRWLRDRGQPVPEAKPGPMKMKMNGVEHEMLMPGMLTNEQLKQLELARGPDFDWLFITFMIQHHRGAVEMVKQLFAAPGAAQDETVFKFASDVNVDQTTEINRMVKLLATLPSTRSP